MNTMSRIKFPKDSGHTYIPIEIVIISNKLALFLGEKVEFGGEIFQDTWFYFNPSTGNIINRYVDQKK